MHINGRVLDWLKAFLSNRYQYVKDNGKFSKKFQVVSGFPHGNVKDIPEVTNSEMSLFADDSKLVEELNKTEDTLNFDFISPEMLRTLLMTFV